MVRYRSIILLVTSIMTATAHSLPKLIIKPKTRLTSNSLYKPGDYIIGGIFSLHAQSSSLNYSHCYNFNDVGE